MPILVLALSHLIKVDIADGFYRMCLNPADIPKLGVVFPTKPGDEPMVGFPPTPHGMG
jgi:hypothetical protein